MPDFETFLKKIAKKLNLFQLQLNQLCHKKSLDLVLSSDKNTLKKNYLDKICVSPYIYVI